MQWLVRNFPTYRDLILFVGGLAGVAHETLIASAERPTLLILFAAMMGLPAFLRTDGAKEIQEAAKDAAKSKE